MGNGRRSLTGQCADNGDAKEIGHGGRMPSTSARRFDSAAIKGMSDRAQRGCPFDPNGAQHRRDLLGKGRGPFDQNGPP